VMLVLHNITIIPSNLKKNKGTTECYKSNIICYFGTPQYEVGTIEYEKRKKRKKKKRELLNVGQVQSHLILKLRNVWIISSNVRKK